MKKIALILVLLLSAVIQSEKALASHAAAGEIVYEWVADSTYRFYVVHYRDCTGIKEYDTVRLCFDNPCNPSQNFSLLLNKAAGHTDTTLPGCPLYPTQCEDITSTLTGYRKWAYSALVTMPARCSAWKISAIIDTRNGAANLGYNWVAFYIEAMMNNTGTYQGNSSPYFTTWGTPYGCINQAISFNNGAVDPNGDSLFYQPLNPRTLPYAGDCNSAPTIIAYPSTSPSLSIWSNPIQTYNTFSLNGLTGTMNFTPVELGRGTIVTRVMQYRNNVLIGYTDREIQMQINNCSASAPTFGASTPGVIQACVGQPLNFCWWAKSGYSAARLKASDNHTTSIPGSTVTYQLQATDSVSGCLSWTPNLNQTGWHTLNIFVKDSTCDASNPTLGYYNYAVQVYVVEGPGATKDTIICPKNAVQLTTSGTGPYTWNVISGPPNSLSCTNCQNPIATPATTTTYQVVLSNATGCTNNKDTVTIDVIPHILPSSTITVTPDTNVLAGTMVTFTATPTNCNNTSYQWQRNGSDLPGAKLATWSSANLANGDVIYVKMTCSDTCNIDTFSNKLKMHIGTGIKTTQFNTIAIHPNPNTGEFAITGYTTAEEVSIEIVNITGQVVYRQNKVATVDGKIDHKVNTGNIANGNYMLRIKTTDKVLTERLTIQR